jgi:hypothetical protein
MTNRELKIFPAGFIRRRGAHLALPALTAFLIAWAAFANRSGAAEIPIRGLHLMAPAKKDLPAAVQFIREVLPKEGVNTLVLEFDYNFNFQSRPEFSDAAALGKAEVTELVNACREKGIELIPQMNCLGHQSWAKHNGKLLQKHPELDETPGKFPENKDIYCRSYCPLHPQVHAIVFDLMDELASACAAKSFHVGMDEVFILADPDCPRCQGKEPARLLANEIKTLNDHLKSTHRRTWLWGDRLLDGKALKLGKWEGSENNTASAIDLVPKDVVICDWHYEKAGETPRLFAEKGFDVVACPWRKPNVALDQLKQIRALRAEAGSTAGPHALGVMQTTWGGFSSFVHACEALKSGEPVEKGPSEAAHCFSTLFKALRDESQ